MTPVWIVVIVVVGLLVVGGLLVAMVRWLRKSYDAEESAVLDRLRQEAPRRGWTFEERADHHTEVFDELERYPRLIPAVFGIDLPPTALRAHDVVTGQHRGRPFLAARFHVNRPADGVEAGSAVRHRRAVGPDPGAPADPRRAAGVARRERRQRGPRAG